MQLDDLKEAWADHGRMLERRLTIDERVLGQVLRRRLRFALAPYVLVRALEVVVGLAALKLGLPVLGAHFSEPRYLLAGGGLVLYTVVVLALSACLLVQGLRLGYDGPVTATQGEVERLKRLEYRSFKWALLGGVALWLPALLVLFEGVTGIPALARVELGWLAANLVVGLALLALGQLWSRRYVERSQPPPWARRLVDGLSSRPLRLAAEHLAEIARFEREEPPAG